MLEVDYGGQNILSPRALPLVVEGLPVADIGEKLAHLRARWREQHLVKDAP